MVPLERALTFIDIFYFKGGNMNTEIKFFEDYVRDFDLNNPDI